MNQPDTLQLHWLDRNDQYIADSVTSDALRNRIEAIQQEHERELLTDKNDME